MNTSWYAGITVTPFNVLFLLNFDVLLGFCLISQLSFLCSGIGSGLTMSTNCSVIFAGQMPFLSCKQRCKSIEENSEH